MGIQAQIRQGERSREILTGAAQYDEVAKLRKALRDLLMERSLYTERAAREALGIDLMGDAA